MTISEQASITSGGPPRWLAVSSGAISLVAAAAAIFANVATNALQVEQAKLKASLETAEDRRKADDQKTRLAFDLYEKVNTTLTEMAKKEVDDASRDRRYRATYALVLGMKDYTASQEMVKGLLASLESVSDPKTAEDLRSKKFDADVPDYVVPPSSTPLSGTKSSTMTSRAPSGQSLLDAVLVPSYAQGSTLDLRSMSIDVFYCSNPGADYVNSGRRILAKDLVDQLGQNTTRGRLRLRELPESVNRRPGYNVQSNQIRYDPGVEGIVAKELIAFFRSTPHPAQFEAVAVTSNVTPGYMSIFVCGK